jgi:hypothetical protein
LLAASIAARRLAIHKIPRTEVVLQIRRSSRIVLAVKRRSQNSCRSRDPIAKLLSLLAPKFVAKYFLAAILAPRLVIPENAVSV